MTMKVAFEHLYIRGVHRVKLTKFRVMNKEKLPLAYITNPEITKCYTQYIFGTTTLYVYENRNGEVKFRNFCVGEVMTLDEMAWIVDIMGAAGHKLYEINKAISAEKKEWEGKVETFNF